MTGDQLIVKHKDSIKSLCSMDSVFIEIGSDRGTGSSSLIAKLCNELGISFITVDADDQTAKAVDRIVKDINPNFSAVNSLGEIFLRDYPHKINFVYLDGFDLETVADTPRTAWCESPHETYRKRNVDITNKNCWKMHYDCAVELSNKMVIGGLLFIDDVYSGAPEWKGKGKTAIPYLLENGFEVVEFAIQSLLLKKVK